MKIKIINPNTTQSMTDSVEKLAEQYGSSLRLVVGTVEPNIPGVPFITADRVFSREGISAEGSATMEAFTGTAKHPEEVQ